MDDAESTVNGNPRMQLGILSVAVKLMSCERWLRANEHDKSVDNVISM